MFKVKVLTIGKSKEKWLLEALSEYEKRLKGKLLIDWIFIKTDRELIDCSKNEPYIALDPHGEMLSSEEWSEKMVGLGLKLQFIIGGPDGLPEAILKRAKWIWSLSPLTFTHQMTRLILLEQLYRAMEIGRGSPYHRSEPHESRALHH